MDLKLKILQKGAIVFQSNNKFKRNGNQEIEIFLQLKQLLRKGILKS